MFANLYALFELLGLTEAYHEVWGSVPMMAVHIPGKEAGEPNAYVHVIEFRVRDNGQWHYYYRCDRNLKLIFPNLPVQIIRLGPGDWDIKI